MQQQDDHLPPYRLRPRFEVETHRTPDEVADTIRAALKAKNTPVKARFIPGYATLFIAKEEQHYWSPQLTLSLEATENGSLLRGLYGPAPSVWTMFTFFYAALAFAIVILSVIGFANMGIGKSGAILWLVPILMIAFLSLYLIAFMGQRLGHDQMVQLHTFVEESLEMRIE